MITQPIASHFINGQYVEDKNGSPIDVVYPATGEVIARVYEATSKIIDNAITSAKSAQTAWAKLSGTERGRVLLRAASIIRERNRDLSILETYDTGKPLSETLYADATSAADALEYFGGLAGTITGEHIPLSDGNWAYTKYEPLGVCLGIGAWNYPTQISCWKGAPALACGNAMIFKPSEITPLCALKIAEILESRGMTKVDTSRVTARIPVIQFIDPVTGLDCDICINNQLALRNTKLLRSYQRNRKTEIGNFTFIVNEEKPTTNQLLKKKNEELDKTNYNRNCWLVGAVKKMMNLKCGLEEIGNIYEKIKIPLFFSISKNFYFKNNKKFQRMLVRRN